MEHSKQNIASLIVLKTQLSYEDKKPQSSENMSESEEDETGNEVSAVKALVNLFQLREKAARDSEAMNCQSRSKFCAAVLKLSVDHLISACHAELLPIEIPGEELSQSDVTGELLYGTHCLGIFTQYCSPNLNEIRN